MTYRVLMVCTGNICRSVMAEKVLTNRLGDLDVEVDSAGISAEESGNPIDYRAEITLNRAGYEVGSHVARKITAEDLDRYDLILTMTDGHYRGVERLAEFTGRAPKDLRPYRSFDPDARGNLDVPDPWYGDMSDFAETLDTIEEVTPGLLEFLESQPGE